jgi:hypothetical protein
VTENLIRRVYDYFLEQRRLAAIERREQKRFDEKLRRECDLFLDDLKFQRGLTWENPEHRMLISILWYERCGVRVLPENDEGDWDNSPENGLDF